MNRNKVQVILIDSFFRQLENEMSFFYTYLFDQPNDHVRYSSDSK